MAPLPVIRRIEASDNPAVADIIRQVMTEFGAVGCGFSIEDSEVDTMFESYPEPESIFFVIEQENRLLGCGGVGPLIDGGPGVCELRKMYFLPELRGSGMGGKLLSLILDAARGANYSQCYLETLDNMNGARRLYLKHGFKFIEGPLGNTGHSGCNNYMLLNPL